MEQELAILFFEIVFICFCCSVYLSSQQKTLNYRALESLISPNYRIDIIFQYSIFSFILFLFDIYNRISMNINLTLSFLHIEIMDICLSRGFILNRILLMVRRRKVFRVQRRGVNISRAEFFFIWLYLLKNSIFVSVFISILL